MSRWFRWRKQVAVVGTFNSGKTVFITSLLNHLRVHDSQLFRPNPDGNVDIRKFDQVPLHDGETLFPYDAYRDALIHDGNWPTKTTDAAHYRCTFERTDWKTHDVELHIFDFPGERIADVAIARFDTWEEWSDHMVGLLKLHEYRPYSKDFVDLMESDQAVDEETWISAYKTVLARFILNYKPLVTPSTFLLDANGQQARGSTVDELVAGRVVGLAATDEDEEDDSYGEFVPLPAAVREADPELAERFALRYATYREQLVLPVFHHLKSCHQVIVTVDVTMLLAGGIGLYNDTVQVLEDLFRILEPKNWLENVWQGLLDVFGKTYGKIEKVAFVATQLDRVAEPDRARVPDLLRQLVQPIARDLDVPSEVFACAAVRSTQIPKGASDRRLVGRLLRHDGQRLSPSDPAREFQVSALPEQWPENWEAGEYSFPYVFPNWPKNRSMAPDQIGVDRVFGFLVS